MSSTSSKKNPSKSSTTKNLNNNPSYPKNIPQKSTNPSNLSTLSYLQDRMLYLIIHLVGKKVEVQVKDGSWYEGILHTVEHGNKSLGVALKWARKKDKNANVDKKKKKLFTTPPIENLLIAPSDFIQLNAIDVSLDSKFDKNEFSTDSEISGRTLKEKELIPWQNTSGETNGISIDFDEQTHRGWDQYAVNDIKSTYKEEFYTTPLDRNDVVYKSKQEEAAKIAQEIESSKATYSHQLEERGHDVDIDEEEMYGAVKRVSNNEKQQKNQQTNQQTNHQQQQRASHSISPSTKQQHHPKQPISQIKLEASTKRNPNTIPEVLTSPPPELIGHKVTFEQLEEKQKQNRTEQRRNTKNDLQNFSESIAGQVKRIQRQEKLKREKMREESKNLTLETKSTSSNSSSSSSEKKHEEEISSNLKQLNPNAPTFKPLNADAPSFNPNPKSNSPPPMGFPIPPHLTNHPTSEGGYFIPTHPHQHPHQHPYMNPTDEEGGQMTAAPFMPMYQNINMMYPPHMNMNMNMMFARAPQFMGAHGVPMPVPYTMYPPQPSRMGGFPAVGKRGSAGNRHSGNVSNSSTNTTPSSTTNNNEQQQDNNNNTDKSTPKSDQKLPENK